MSNVENVCPQVLRGVTRELRRLAANPPAGVKLVLRDDDFTDVLAHIDGPADTPYAGGVFRVRLVLGRDFPTSPPRAYFLTRIFHPNVAPDTGEVCVNTLKRDWKPELGLEHALLAVKCLLIAPNPESALNAEAAALLRERYADYFARAKLLADIHARARPNVPDARPVAEALEGRAESGPKPEEGPCAKRERRPAGAGAGASSASAASASAASASAASASATSASATSASATSAGATSTAATGTAATGARGRERARRILKRL